MKVSNLFIGALATAVLAKNIKVPPTNELSSEPPVKKLGVADIHAEDNMPSSKHANKPLEPHGEGSGHGAVGSKNPAIDSDEEDSLEGASSFKKLVMPISMIVVSEIGDKTFLIAALMAMKHSRFVVFTSAFSSLVVMTVLSGVIGHALPSLISQRLTQFLASILFVVFGYKLLREGLEMSKEAGVDEELAEVEEELASSSINSRMNDIEMQEAGGIDLAQSISKKSTQWLKEVGSNVQNLASFVLSPIWIQVFIMTFLGEWGDRSQIAIIAMAAVPNYWIVILGAVIGHGLCTAAACLGGKLLAKRISMRNVTLGGAAAFLIFAISYFYDALYNEEL